MGVDLKLTARRVAARVVALGVDAVAAGRILAETLPGDDEASGGIHRYGGIELVTADMGIDLEFAAHRVAVRVIALGVDPVTDRLVLADALPGNDEVPGGIHGHRGVVLGRRFGY